MPGTSGTCKRLKSYDFKEENVPKTMQLIFTEIILYFSMVLPII